jgi:hypothetical protein
MPKINRIRIVNFSYNHESRHIVDETFHFHGGEDALLSLSNGGGKSVLVQLFLQVIVPGAKIQGRNISGFFRKQKLPAYIMIEWKLDGARGGYLLTGIGITAMEDAEQEGARQRIRYFNFTSKYTGANAFDIASIPLVERSGGVLEVKPFREARKLLADKEKKDPYLVGYYSEDERDSYGKRLAEFGIVQDEWRNVMVRINNNENGLEDLFQRIKTSSQLLDEWIIKTVEDVMYKGRSEQRQLEDMLQSLVQEVVENERFIMEKQLFTGFLQDLQEVSSELEGLLKSLEEQRNLGANLAAMHGYLGEEINAQREKQRSNEMEIGAAGAEEQRVTMEERSCQYQQRLEEHREALEKLAAAEKSFNETEEEISLAKRQEMIMQAARLVGEIRQMISELAGIEEKLAMAREDYNKDDQAGRLEYTLKIKCEELLQSLAAELTVLRAEKIDLQERLKRGREEQRGLETEKSRLDSEKGRLEERLRNFNDQEKQLQKRLGQQWIRNLLGELDPAETNQVMYGLIKTRDQVQSEHDKMLAEKDSLAQQQQEMDLQWKKIQTDQSENSQALNDYERELAEYLKREQQVKAILERYGFDSALVFDHERLTSLFTQHIKELELKAEAAARNRNEADEALASIKNGQLHSSPELASALAELDIQYDTGENYLRNQSPDIRQAMLKGNPILPYTFIMSRTDLNRIAAAGLNMIMRRIIPLMAYEDLNLLVENQGGIARPREEIAFACLYEGRIFDQENLHKLILEMEAKRKEAAARYGHYSEEHRAALVDLSTCQRFDYAADFRYGLEKGIAECQKRHLAFDQQLSDLEDKKIQAIDRQKDFDEQIRNLAEQKHRADEALQAFREFLDREQEYQLGRGRLNQIKQDLLDLAGKKDLLNKSLDNLQTELSVMNNKITEREKQQQAAEQKYLLYKDAPPAECLTGTIEELETRLKAIKEEYSREIGQLEESQQSLTTRSRNMQKQLDKLGLAEEDYADIRFDEDEAEAIRKEIIRLDAVLKIMQKEFTNASRAEASAATAVSNALDEVKRLGAEVPLPPQEIKGNFAERRGKLRQHIRELEGLNKNISQTLSRYLRIRENIEQVLDLTSIEAAKDFVSETDIIAQSSRWEKTYRDLQSSSLENAGKIRNRYNNCKADYRDKNMNLDNIFKGLDPLWDQAQMAFDDFYYLFERMSQHGEKLAELIAIYETQLANLERNKRDMVQQSFMQGRRMYEEIDLISDNSKVSLQGRSRPVQMLRIDLQLDSQELAQQRVNDYIEECIAKVREKTRQDNREDELRRTIARLMSSRELLNVYLGKANIPVYVFKIDMNKQNSRLKLWEDAVRENSGAEKFVVFFSVLSALMTYTRTRNMEALGADPDKDTRVLIMDNPFGPISSEHLLRPMFEIAKRHRTQLICLSDLKQNSILNCFNLIYMLKVRTGAIDGKEYLKFEEYVRDENALVIDEKLEKAFFRASDFKQMPLFDEEE